MGIRLERIVRNQYRVYRFSGMYGLAYRILTYAYLLLFNYHIYLRASGRFVSATYPGGLFSIDAGDAESALYLRNMVETGYIYFANAALFRTFTQRSVSSDGAADGSAVLHAPPELTLNARGLLYAQALPVGKDKS